MSRSLSNNSLLLTAYRGDENEKCIQVVGFSNRLIYLTFSIPSDSTAHNREEFFAAALKKRPDRVSGSSRVKTYGSVEHAICQPLAD